MAQIESWFTQDLKKPVKVQMLNGNLFSQDNQGNLIGVKVYDDDEPAALAGTVSANIIRADGGTVAATGTLDGNKCILVLPAAAYAVPGIETIVVKLTSNGVVTTLLAVVVTIYRSSTDTAVDPGTVMPSIQALIQQINTAVASIPADYSSLWTSLAPAFSTDASYVAWQHVTNNGKVYRFNTAHAAGAWVESEVTEVKLGNEISDLKSKIEYLADEDQLLLIYSLSDIHFSRTYSVPVNIPAGVYTVIVDNFTATDAPYDTSRISLYMGSTYVAKDVERGQRVEYETVVGSDVTQISLYGGHTYGDSVGTTCSIDSIKIVKKTQLGDRINNLETYTDKVDRLYLEDPVIVHKSHTNKAISIDGSSSLGLTGSLVKIFKVTPGETYKLVRSEGLVRYGFANTDPGNNNLVHGGNGDSPINIIAPEGYIYLYMQDVRPTEPNGECFVYHVIPTVNYVSEKVEPLVGNVSNILNRVKGKYVCHIGVDKHDDIIIPNQSLADIERARRLGFNAIEINVRKTSDGKYICLHGSSGAFGSNFVDVDGNSVANVQVSTMTLQEIKNTIRFKTDYDRYRTAPYTLEEMLYQCKLLNMIPLVEFNLNYEDEIQILDSIMGKNNYLLASYGYTRDQIGSDAPMYSYLSTSDADNVVNICKTSGGAYVAGINVTNSAFSEFTLDDWRAFVEKIHAAGYMVSSAYGDEQLNQTLLKSGFDVINSTSRNINEVENPNVYNIVDNVDFAGFETNGTISGGVLTLTDGQTITPDGNKQKVFLGGASMHIRYSGTIKLEMGVINANIQSDGLEESWFSSFYEDKIPTFKITAVGSVEITSLSFKASEV